VRSLAPILALAALLSTAGAAAAQGVAGDGWWWFEPYPERFDATGLEMRLDVVRVEGNHFVDAAGRKVVFKGVSISDPDKIERDGHWSKAHFEAVKGWGANVVRIPVHPVAWRGRGKESYFELLDQAVRWATELDLYVMIDWHSIGNVLTGLYQHPMYDTTRQETLEFWRSVAYRYRGVPTVAFYEIFNEPTTFNGTLGQAPWAEWKAFNEEVIGILFAHDKDVIPLVAGFNWAYDLTPVAQAPIDSPGIGYVSHPYPQKVEPPYAPKWEHDFGFVAERYPLVVTEFGYAAADARGAHVPVIAGDDYGPTILDYLDSKGASWVAWCFDPDWGPLLISDWDYTPTAAGAFFRQAMGGSSPADD
jgi:endoglucanase